MINKITIDKAWRHNPKKVYYVIQNPKIDKKKQKVIGSTIKTVEYKVRDWDKKFVNFEKIDKDKDKRFPEILSFDKRYPDAEDEVLAERVSKAKKKPDFFDSYGIFGEEKVANYNKLVRLHRLATDLANIYKILKGKNENNCQEYDGCNTSKNSEKCSSCSNESTDNCCNTCDSSDDKLVKEAKKETEKKDIDLSLEEIKSYFEEIQNTGYFDELDRIQTENPDLATM